MLKIALMIWWTTIHSRVHQVKTPIAASKLLVSEVADRQLKQQLEQEIFKIDSYTNLVLQYLRLESFH